MTDLSQHYRNLADAERVSGRIEQEWRYLDMAEKERERAKR